MKNFEPKTYQLICDGRCNANQASKIIEEMRRWRVAKTAAASHPESVMRRHRALIYTPHTMTGRGVATC